MHVTPIAPLHPAVWARIAVGARLSYRAAVLLVAAATSVQAAPAPTFNDPVALVGWLLRTSGHGFNALDDAADAPVFSPGLRAAVRASLTQARRTNDPPCGGDGDFILDTQENGVVRNVRLNAQATGTDRRAVSASYDVDGYHRERRFMVVLLDGAWKLENIVEANGRSLRRALGCGR